MSGPVSFINVIDVDPATCQEVIDLLVEGTESVVSKRPGFTSLTILVSADRRRVVNLAHWRSVDDIRATQADPAAAAYAARTAAIATPHPGVYSVAAEIVG